MSRIQKRTLSTTLAVLFVLFLCTFVFTASAEKTKATSVTGCLQTGDEAGEYYLKTSDGKVYGLRSSAVKLSDHVGHQVTVSGKAKAEKDDDEDEANEAKENKEKEKGEKREAGDIQVTSLKVVSSSCQ